MTEKILDSNPSGMTRSSSHLPSIYGNDFLELVLENGQILVSSNKTHEKTIPSCIDHDEHGSFKKRARLSTFSSLLDQFPTQRDSQLSSSHQINGQNSCENKNNCSPKIKKTRMNLSQDERKGKVNFPNFSIPQVFLTRNNNASNSSSIGSTKVWQSQDFKGFQKQQPLTNSSPLMPLQHHQSFSSRDPSHTAHTILSSNIVQRSINGRDRPGDQRPDGFVVGEDPNSYLTANKFKPKEAKAPLVDYNSALGIHKSHGDYNQTSNLEAPREKGKEDINLSNEHLGTSSSSVCSLGGSNDPNSSVRKHEDTTDGSMYLNDNDDEEHEDIVKETHEGSRVKKRRNPEIHNLSERKRRDKINKRMRALKELIPNCKKMDKASMLDYAIDYLKTLKLQIQMMSMRSGLCMPLMMLPSSSTHYHQLMGLFRGGGAAIPYTAPHFPFPVPPFSPITDVNRLHHIFSTLSNQMPLILPHAPPPPFVPPPLIGNNSSTQPPPPLVPENMASTSSDLHAK